MIAEALALGIRTIIDIVPNHVSDQHPWFIQAHAGGPGSPMRDRFWFRRGRGAGGDEPPNDWTSHFGDSAWTRTKNPDGTRGDWFLHLFAPGQPDLNWDHPAVREEHEAILRFWFDRGAAGIRIDSAALAIKDPALPDLADDAPGGEHPFVDRDEIHDVYRSWRAIADSYDPPRALIGEVWLEDRQRFARYLRPDELHGAFNFDFLACPWDAAALRACIDDTLDSHAPVGAPPSWVLSNHDVTRVVTRYGRADTTFSFAAKRIGTPTDLALGLRRARAAALLVAALPGTLYVYQGEELGLPEVEDLPLEHLQDPMHFQSGGTDPGRDGCRVPLPWDGTQPPYGFGPAGSHAVAARNRRRGPTLTVAAEDGDPTSMLSLYRDVIALRRDRLVGDDEPLHWLPRAGRRAGLSPRRHRLRRQPVPRSRPAACRDRPDHQRATGRRPAPGRHGGMDPTRQPPTQTRNSKEQSSCDIGTEPPCSRHVAYSPSPKPRPAWPAPSTRPPPRR